MNTRQPTPRQLEELFQDLEDGLISGEDHAWLMNLLREDRVVRKAYLKHMTMVTGLHDYAAANAPEADTPACESFETRDRSMLRRSFFAAAALVVLLAAIGSLIAIRSEFNTGVSVVAGHATNWRFSSGGIGENGDFLPGTRVVVDRGTLEITSRSRTRMLLEGPTVMEIHDRKNATLASGKGWFDVAKKDVGFTVLTEHIRVIDLGTRFGVATTPFADKVQVDSGHVRVKSRFPGIKSVDLKTGDAIMADLVGRSTRVPYDQGLFLRNLARKPVYIHWNFDSPSDGEFAATASGFLPTPIAVTDFKARPVKPRLVPGPFGSALDLTSDDSFAVSAFAGVSGTGPRTVAMWIKSRPIERRIMPGSVEYTPPVLLWGDIGMGGGFWSVRTHTQSGLLGTQWSENAWTISGKYEAPGIIDGEWHHIASVFTGQVDELGRYAIEHYVDGQHVESRWRILGNAIDTDISEEPSTNLRLGYDPFFVDGPRNTPVAIDELHIFRSALSAEEIESLYRENRIEDQTQSRKGTQIR
jgi:hypothetical protein